MILPCTPSPPATGRDPANRRAVLAAIAQARDDVRRAAPPLTNQAMREITAVARRVFAGTETDEDRTLIPRR